MPCSYLASPAVIRPTIVIWELCPLYPLIMLLHEAIAYLAFGNHNSRHILA